MVLCHSPGGAEKSEQKWGLRSDKNWGAVGVKNSVLTIISMLSRTSCLCYVSMCTLVVSTMRSLSYQMRFINARVA